MVNTSLAADTVDAGRARVVTAKAARQRAERMLNKHEYGLEFDSMSDSKKRKDLSEVVVRNAQCFIEHFHRHHDANSRSDTPL
jgi:hypothetical protein